jgi:hypothetical protein
VTAGVTVQLVPVTTPGLAPVLADISNEFAPLTDQSSVAEAPALMFDGVAENNAICGSEAVTVTVTFLVTLPPAFVAVSV